jgi:hypothetical protein
MFCENLFSKMTRDDNSESMFLFRVSIVEYSFLQDEEWFLEGNYSGSFLFQWKFSSLQKGDDFSNLGIPSLFLCKTYCGSGRPGGLHQKIFYSVILDFSVGVDDFTADTWVSSSPSPRGSCPE